MADNEITNEQNEITNRSLVKNAAREIFESIDTTWQDIEYENVSNDKTRAINALFQCRIIFLRFTHRFDNIKKRQYGVRTYYCTGDQFFVNLLIAEKVNELERKSPNYRECVAGAEEKGRLIAKHIKLTVLGETAQKAINNGQRTLDDVINEIVDGFFDKNKFDKNKTDPSLPVYVSDVDFQVLPMESETTAPAEGIIAAIKELGKEMENSFITGLIKTDAIKQLPDEDMQILLLAEKGLTATQIRNFLNPNCKKDKEKSERSRIQKRMKELLKQK